MAFITRRTALSQLLVGASAHISGLSRYKAISSLVGGACNPSEVRDDNIAKLASSFMNRFDVPGLSVAIAQGKTLRYQKSFGVSDAETGEKLTDSHLFRVASLTKPITSAAVFSLLQSAAVKLHNTVFGEHGILGKKYGAPPYQKYIEEITIEHLLTHTSGGWPNDSTDPMLRFRDLNQDELISWVIHKLPLAKPPGTFWTYSNFGYCILGRIIEELSGNHYVDCVKDAILSPCGIHDMEIAGNVPRERLRNEVVYYGQGESPHSVNVRRMDANGGWLATSTDLALFASRLDDVLNPKTIETMLTPSSVNPTYAKGWSIDRRGASHNGSLPGTTTYLLRDNTGMCCAALTNTRRQPHQIIDSELQRMMLAIIEIFQLP
jgi:CubicO group peptidase (beta-lactamase class C family)